MQNTEYEYGIIVNDDAVVIYSHWDHNNDAIL